MVSPYRLTQGSRHFLTACRKEAKASCPLPLTGPCRLDGANLANRLAASRNYKHSWPKLAPLPAYRPYRFENAFFGKAGHAKSGTASLTLPNLLCRKRRYMSSGMLAVALCSVVIVVYHTRFVCCGVHSTMLHNTGSSWSPYHDVTNCMVSLSKPTVQKLAPPEGNACKVRESGALERSEASFSRGEGRFPGSHWTVSRPP